ncbi:radical SAM protein [Clostridium felsineum]|uniref:radical SAM protein n=1 Tax=Clostridium felsineum TaxID=36839 RepID=UPI00098C1E92|nr:radical SAM protein [Clostridium felsineum]URZ18158.1 GTP 3',8-cyclase [Clostridium felsineum DSM 794]
MIKNFNKEEYDLNYSKMKKVLKYYNKRHFFEDGTPLVLSFLTTNKCCLRCKHCFYHETLDNHNKSNQEKELTIDQYEKISNSMQWFNIGIFTGGEPFMRNDLHEIIHIFRTNNNMPWCDSATNGQLTESILKQTELICKQDSNKIYSLSFSIEGFEEDNDAIRGKGTFKKSLETLQECKKLKKYYKNLELNLCSTFNSINQERYSEFLNWYIKNFEPDKVTLLKIRQTPRAGKSLCDIDDKLYEKAIKNLGQYISEGKFGDVNKPETHFTHQMSCNTLETTKTGKRNFYCYAGKHGGWIDYNGNVSVCEVFPDVKTSGENLLIGNLKNYDMDFMKLWNSERAYQVKQKVGKMPICSKCTHETEGQIPSLYFEPNDCLESKQVICRY